MYSKSISIVKFQARYRSQFFVSMACVCLHLAYWMKNIILKSKRDVTNSKMVK